jgi:hypothetical protein
MTHHRIATLLTLALFVGLIVVPVSVAAPASSLLSGYGGPGAGDQAILGSTLVGGPGGGGGSSGTGSGNLGAGSGEDAGGGLARAGQEQSAAPSRLAAPGNGRQTQHPFSSGRTSSGASPAYKNLAGSVSAGIVSSREESGTLGLTDSDLLIMLFVACALVLIGGVTRRLAQTAV